MTANEFFNHVAGGRILPLYYFHGPEEGLIEEALAKIAEKVLHPSAREFDRALLDGLADDPETILTSLQTFPLRSRCRLVVIRRADALWNRGPSPIMEYLRSPNPGACAVFLGEKADLRREFFQVLAKKGAVVTFLARRGKELLRFVRSQAEEEGHPISDEALDLLLRHAGSGLKGLKGELGKLYLGVGEGKPIEQEDVRALTADAREESLFELPRAVGQRNLAEALRLLRKLLLQGESPVLLLSLIARQLRLIWRGAEMRAAGRSKREIEAELGVPPGVAENFWRQTGNFSSPLLARIWPHLLRIDRELKSSPAERGLLLEELLWTIHLRAEEERVGGMT